MPECLSVVAGGTAAVVMLGVGVSAIFAEPNDPRGPLAEPLVITAAPLVDPPPPSPTGNAALGGDAPTAPDGAEAGGAGTSPADGSWPPEPPEPAAAAVSPTEAGQGETEPTATTPGSTARAAWSTSRSAGRTPPDGRWSAPAGEPTGDADDLTADRTWTGQALTRYAPSTWSGQPRTTGAPDTWSGPSRTTGAPDTWSGQSRTTSAPDTWSGQPRTTSAPDDDDLAPTAAEPLSTTTADAADTAWRTGDGSGTGVDPGAGGAPEPSGRRAGASEHRTSPARPEPAPWAGGRAPGDAAPGTRHATPQRQEQVTDPSDAPSAPRGTWSGHRGRPGPDSRGGSW